MTYSINILKKELKEWKEQYAYHKYYYEGFYDDKEAIRAFKDDKKHIAELEQAIKILKKSSTVVHVHNRFLIRVTNAEIKSRWYANKIGQTYIVEEDPNDSSWWVRVWDNNKFIHKKDAKVLKAFIAFR